MLKKSLVAAAFAASSFVGSGAYAAVIDLGFIMDRSNSVSEANFTAAMKSLGDALESSLAPTIGSANTYVVSVVAFNDSAQDVAGAKRVTVDSAAKLTALAKAVRDAGPILQTSGATCYQCGFDELRNNYAAGELGASSIVNMMTDGVPNVGNSTTGRNDLRTAGWDSLSFESIGSGASDATLSALAYDTGGLGGAVIANPALITDPLNSAFVLKVAGFGAAYDAAIKAKIQRIVTPTIPVPAALPLLAGGLALFGFLGRRRRAAA